MAFDIAKVLGDVSGTDTGREQIVYLDPDLLDPDDNNFYSLEGLDELAANIELIGLQQPLRVRPGAGGRYIIVSGHRRRAAILMIRDSGSQQFAGGVPCIVEYGEASAAMRELRLIYANAATRKMTSADLSKQAERVEMLLYQLKEEGVEFPGRMRDHVAEACKVSKTKIARLHAIRANLVPFLLRRFDNGEMTEELAYQLSRLPNLPQHAVDACLTNGKRKQMPYAWAVENIVKDLDTYTKPAKCDAHAGLPDCDQMHTHICRSLWEPYRPCAQLVPGKRENGICCRACNEREKCAWACKECRERRALDKAIQKEKETEQAKRDQADRDLKQRIYKRQRREQAERVKRAADRLGLDDGFTMATQYHWQTGPSLKEIRRAADGDFGNEYYYDGDLLPTDVATLKTWAEVLDCSLDYLAGLSAEPKPEPTPAAEGGGGDAPAWSTGAPPRSGLYVIKCGVPLEDGPQWRARRIVVWTGDSWVTPGPGVPVKENVYGWYKIPED